MIKQEKKKKKETRTKEGESLCYINNRKINKTAPSIYGKQEYRSKIM